MPVGFLRVYRQFSIWVKVGRVMQRQNNTPLTPEQRKLAEKHHNLIFYFMKRKRLDQEEFYDILAIALCKAVRSYGPSEYTFATYCYRCFENALRMHIRDNKRRVQSAPFSAFEIHDDSGDIDNVIEETVSCEKAIQTFDELETYMAMEGFVSRIPEQLRQVLKLHLKEYTQQQIAEILGISQPQVSRTLARIRMLYKKYIDR